MREGGGSEIKEEGKRGKGEICRGSVCVCKEESMCMCMRECVCVCVKDRACVFLRVNVVCVCVCIKN